MILCILQSYSNLPTICIMNKNALFNIKSIKKDERRLREIVYLQVNVFDLRGATK